MFVTMKHSKLHGIAHNYADSLAGGLSFVVPNYVLSTSVYAEAAATPGKFVGVNLLDGQVEGAFAGSGLEHAAALLGRAFPAFCAKHGVDHADYAACLLRFIAGLGGTSYIITVEDRTGRRSAREYVGRPGRRSRAPDHLGRLRPKPIASPEE